MASAEAKYSPYANSPKFLKNNGHLQRSSTIRTVPSFEGIALSTSDDTSSASERSPSARNSSAFSSSVNSNASASAASYYSQSGLSQNGSATVRFNPGTGGGQSYSNSHSTMAAGNSSSTLRVAETESRPGLQVPDSNLPIAEEHMQAGGTAGVARESSPQWDGTVGKAALGKTGRVINKLVSDNEALKRDIKLERIKSEEARQTAKLLEDKMERMISEYESRLLEANVTKTLLSRKERQVETLQGNVELEKKRAAEALERERVWREEMDRSKRDATVQVEEAKAQATLMEGRYNAISSHWRDQGEQVRRATASVRKQITELVEERREDDEKIQTLKDLCDQQDGNIRDLQRQKDEIGIQFERYKSEQEEALREMKRKARETEEEHTRALQESKTVLGQLKWALNVKEHVKGAQ